MYKQETRSSFVVMVNAPTCLGDVDDMTEYGPCIVVSDMLVYSQTLYMGRVERDYDEIEGNDFLDMADALSYETCSTTLFDSIVEAGFAKQRYEDSLLESFGEDLIKECGMSVNIHPVKVVYTIQDAMTDDEIARQVKAEVAADMGIVEDDDE